MVHRLTKAQARRIAVRAQLLDANLPILHEDRLIGKLDAIADRKGSVLRVNAIHEDVAFTAAMTRAVQDELDNLASWLRIAVGKS